MNRLPEECLILIFKKVDLLQLLKLREVCVTWKAIIESMRIKHVNVVDSQFNRREKWDLLGLELVSYESLLYHSKPSLLISLFRAPAPTGSLQLVCKNAMFSRLKSMLISLPSISEFRFENYINPFFRQLEELAFLDLNLGATLEQTCLNLPHLKTLSIHGFRMIARPIKLELPSLHQFSTNRTIDFFEFAHPETVTHMFLSEDDESIVQFVNLECLSCCIYNHESVIFSALTKLKRIHYDNTREILFKDFAMVHRDKQNSGRQETKIIIRGVDYQDYRFQRGNKFTFESTWKNYLAGKLITSGPISVVPNSIDFNSLSDELDGQSIPADFKESFSNIRTIRVSRKIEGDVKLFFNLLDHHPNLNHLQLSSAFDGYKDQQRYYDSLPNYSKYVQRLEISSGDQEASFDLNFVLRFSYLQRFKYNKMVGSNFVRLLFETLKYFVELELELTREVEIKIIKKETFFVPRFLLQINEENSETFLNLGRLIASYQEKFERIEVVESGHSKFFI